MRVKIYLNFDDINYSGKSEYDFIDIDMRALPQLGSIFHISRYLPELRKLPIPSKYVGDNIEETIDNILDVPWYVDMIYNVLDANKYVEYYIDLKPLY